MATVVGFVRGEANDLPPHGVFDIVLDSEWGWRRLLSSRFPGAVAQLVRVPDCRSGGCGFESRPRRLKSGLFLRGFRTFLTSGPSSKLANGTQNGTFRSPHHIGRRFGVRADVIGHRRVDAAVPHQLA